jgi:hypothetical protein
VTCRKSCGCPRKLTPRDDGFPCSDPSWRSSEPLPTAFSRGANIRSCFCNRIDFLYLTPHALQSTGFSTGPLRHSGVSERRSCPTNNSGAVQLKSTEGHIEHLRVCVCVCVSVFSCVYVRVHFRMCMCVCVCVCLFVCACVSQCLCVRVCASEWVIECVYVCVRACV